jgi:hypothetical protein
MGADLGGTKLKASSSTEHTMVAASEEASRAKVWFLSFQPQILPYKMSCILSQ